MASYSKKIAKNIQKSRLKCLLLILFSHWFVRMGLWNRMNGKSTKQEVDGVHTENNVAG